MRGGGALNRCHDGGLSLVGHSELRGKIAPFRPGRGGCPKDRRGNFAWKNVTQFSCNADKNHVTQLRRVDFSLPNLSSNNPSSSTRFCELSASKKQAGFSRLRLENDSEYSFSPWWALLSKEEIRGLSALDGERIASRGWRVLQETKSRSKTWNCRLMRATKQVSRRDEGEMCKEVLC